ncbi:MAG: hypothetical protein LBD69_00540 [Puniceicoccales bacterium]|jgi:hypothetical protein|nr:hypothetical protein [Puniceicoccales bacterium]
MAVSRSSSSSSVQYSSYSMGPQRLHIENMLMEFFRGGAPQLVNELAWRFHSNGVTVQEVESIRQMLILPAGIQLPTHMGRSYEPVSQARLLEVLSHVTQFQCGVRQLIDLAQLCQTNDLHLCFMQAEKYAIVLDDSIKNDKMLYVKLPENANAICETIITNIATMEDKLHIQQVRLLDLLDNNFQRVEGYLIGHELSHAIALAKCYSTRSSFDHSRDIETFLTAIVQRLRSQDIDVSILTSKSRRLTDLLREYLFQTGEEARNILGLGMDEDFCRGDRPIISEFDFLREGTGHPYTRMPYAPLDTIKTLCPKLCMALLTLIFQLKEQSMNPALVLTGEIEALKITLEEVELAGQNLMNIRRQLNAAGYAIFPIRGDGNSGFYAILKALNPTQDYLSFIQEESVEQRSTLPQWQTAVRLRHAIANAPRLDHLREMTTTPLGTEDRQMGFDALPAVARHLHGLEPPRLLVVINTTVDSPDHIFTYYDQNGDMQEAANFQGALNAANPLLDAAIHTTIATDLDPGTTIPTLIARPSVLTARGSPIVLLYRPGHWEAVVPTPPEPKSQTPDDSCGCCGCIPWSRV